MQLHPLPGPAHLLSSPPCPFPPPSHPEILLHQPNLTGTGEVHQYFYMLYSPCVTCVGLTQAACVSPRGMNCAVIFPVCTLADLHAESVFQCTVVMVYPCLPMACYQVSYKQYALCMLYLLPERDMFQPHFHFTAATNRTIDKNEQFSLIWSLVIIKTSYVVGMMTETWHLTNQKENCPICSVYTFLLEGKKPQILSSAQPMLGYSYAL